MVCRRRCHSQIAAVAAEVEKMFVLSVEVVRSMSMCRMTLLLVLATSDWLIQLRLRIACGHPCEEVRSHWNLKFESAVILKFDRN